MAPVEQGLFNPKVDRYKQDINSRAASPIPSDFEDLSHFLSLADPITIEGVFRDSDIALRFEKIKPLLPRELADKTRSLYIGVLLLDKWRKENEYSGLQVPDADVIQGWVTSTFSAEEFPIVASAAFVDWGDRLDETKPIPHIGQANRWIAEKIAEHFSFAGNIYVRAVDLGAGTGATMNAISGALEEKGIEVHISGVDLTSTLVEKARKNTGKQVEVANALQWLEEQEDESLDIISMVYTIHHLHYDDQKKLKKLAFRKLRKGGIFALADPTGTSEFNLRVLDPKEPEATAACFVPSVVNLAREMDAIGFSIPLSDEMRDVVYSSGKTTIVSTEEGNILDQGSLGYGIVAIKA